MRENSKASPTSWLSRIQREGTNSANLNVFTHASNALSAHIFTHQAATFQDFNTLNIGLELAIGLPV
jgi:hypothetical protein